ncbi:MAG: hypothetical protein Q7S98_04125 [Deltaproteobacteria bacterium]|nr:hypothetical protein [Deltaproteobacteria bacterium]
MRFLKIYFVDLKPDSRGSNVVHDVRRALKESAILKGLVTILPPAGGADIVVGSEGEIVEGKGSLSRSLTLPLDKGELLLDSRQQIFLINRTGTASRCEFLVHVFGEGAEAKAAPRGGAPRPAQVPLRK